MLAGLNVCTMRAKFIWRSNMENTFSVCAYVRSRLDRDKHVFGAREDY